MELLINSANGVYIPQIFSERYPEYLTEEQKSDLSNPENEFYWDTWVTILDTVSIDGKILAENGDLWLMDSNELTDEFYN